jgi:hypothetical protein
MPRDVSTRWNSTYDMLDFAVKHQEELDELTRDKALRKYEMAEEEWLIAKQLRDVLEVKFHLCQKTSADHVNCFRGVPLFTSASASFM